VGRKGNDVNIFMEAQAMGTRMDNEKRAHRNTREATCSANELLLGQALLNVLIHDGMLSPDARPTGPELVAAAEVYCGNEAK
jgi:hypothetical protein